MLRHGTHKFFQAGLDTPPKVQVVYIIVLCCFLSPVCSGTTVYARLCVVLCVWAFLTYNSLLFFPLCYRTRTLYANQSIIYYNGTLYSSSFLLLLYTYLVGDRPSFISLASTTISMQVSLQELSLRVYAMSPNSATWVSGGYTIYTAPYTRQALVKKNTIIHYYSL